MSDSTASKLDPVAVQFLEWNGAIALIGLTCLLLTIIYSAKTGGLREVVENLLLWFLLFGGIVYLSSMPVDEDDQITGGILFVAFGLCRIAKHMAKKTEAAGR